MSDLRVEMLLGSRDERGDSFQPIRQVNGFLSEIRDLHIVSIRPGFVRGNHFHPRRKEVLLIQWKSGWRLIWRVIGQQAQEKGFDGLGTALIFIPPSVSHTIVNSGSEDLWITAILDGPYNSELPDVPVDVLV